MPAYYRDRTVYTAVGCPVCKGSGYRGRSGIYELLAVDDEQRRLIHDSANEADIRDHAIKHGLTVLREDGLRWVSQGETSIEEVLRVTRASTEEE
jgi:general secretion pathway protein E